MEAVSIDVTRPSSIRTSLRDDGAYVFHHPPKFLWEPIEVPPVAWKGYTAYLHVPFCRAICTFCTFERSVFDRDLLNRNFESVIAEMRLRRNRDDFTRAHLEAVYLGGGTASLLSCDQIVRFLDELRNGFGWSDEIECTLECEPGTKRLAELRILREAGINRISVGAQTFSGRLLKQLNRRHTPDTTRRMLDEANQAGFENIHADLMYGLPGQTFEEWRDSVEELLAIGIGHISAYRLIVFRDELLARTLAGGALVPLPSRDVIEEMRLFGSAAFTAAGRHQYSLTEFALPGRRCRYVESNWDGSDYLGFGVAAYSRNDDWLWENSVFRSTYGADVADGRLPIGRAIRMSCEQRIARDLAMGLCLLSVDLGRFGDDLRTEAGRRMTAQLRELGAEGLVRIDGEKVALTGEGIRYATQVMKQFAQ